MTRFEDLTRKTVSKLFGDTLSIDRFEKWRGSMVEGVAGTLSQYAFGEIFWKKSLGRPETVKLSDGIFVEAWREEKILVGDVGGAAHWQTIRVPYYPSWWDGKDDGKYWRVSYMVPNMTVGFSADGLSEHSIYSFIVPHLKPDVAWKIPGGRFAIASVGLRVLEPPRVAFVKPDKAVHFSFEVVLELPFKVS